MNYSTIASADNDFDSDRSFVIQLPLEVNPADYPYRLNCNYDDGVDVLTVDLVYDFVEEERDLICEKDIAIEYGRRTGRLYKITIRNAWRDLSLRDDLTALRKRRPLIQHYSKRMERNLAFSDRIATSVHSHFRQHSPARSKKSE